MNFVIYRRDAVAGLMTLKDLVRGVKEGYDDPKTIGDLYFFSAPSWDEADRIFEEEIKGDVQASWAKQYVGGNPCRLVPVRWQDLCPATSRGLGTSYIQNPDEGWTAECSKCLKTKVN